MVDLPAPILAIVYTDGIAADRFLADLGYSLRDAGLLVAGLVQLNSFVRDPHRCDMEIEELSSGTVLQLSEDRGKESRGCRLDRSVLAEAAALLSRALNRKPEVLVLNKFGKTEAEGGGVRDVLARAVEQGVPLIVGVPFRNLDQWRLFASDLARECQVDLGAVRHWLSSWNLVPLDEREAIASAGAVDAAAD
jgi:nucleoside-triphosphatase THEP1